MAGLHQRQLTVAERIISLCGAEDSDINAINDGIGSSAHMISFAAESPLG